MRAITIITVAASALALTGCKTPSEQAEGASAEGTTTEAPREAAEPVQEAAEPKAGAEQGGEASAYTAEQVKTALEAHITTTSEPNQGVFKLEDETTGKELSLELVSVHDTVRKIEGRGYFACVDFRAAGAEEGQLYDVDVFLNPQDGKLVVTETALHKVPKKDGDAWTQEARYTLEQDKIVQVN